MLCTSFRLSHSQLHALTLSSLFVSGCTVCKRCLVWRVHPLSIALCVCSLTLHSLSELFICRQTTITLNFTSRALSLALALALSLFCWSAAKRTWLTLSVHWPRWRALSPPLPCPFTYSLALSVLLIYSRFRAERKARQAVWLWTPLTPVVVVVVFFVFLFVSNLRRNVNRLFPISQQEHANCRLCFINAAISRGI